MHSCFLAAELIMKGLLKYYGKPEKELKKLNHNLSNISTEFSNYCSSVDESALERAIDNLPKSVNERYEVNRYSTSDVGKAIMSVQYVAGSAIRSITDRNLRNTLRIDGKQLTSLRVFP
jgi:hypothetical protein